MPITYYNQPNHCIIGLELEGVSTEVPRGDEPVSFKTDAYCWIIAPSINAETEKKKAHLISLELIPHDKKDDALKATRIFVRSGILGEVHRVLHPFMSKTGHRAHQATINAKQTFAIGFIDPLLVKPPLIKPEQIFKIDEKIKKA